MTSYQDCKTSALVLLSGGIDSTACTHFLKSQGHSVETIFIDYGQASAEKELKASQKIASILSIPLKHISLISSVEKSSGEIKGRNAFLLLTALMEFEKESGLIGIGIHAGTPYFDCSNDFVKKMQVIFDDYTDGKCCIVAPFIDWTKQEIWNYCIQFALPIDVSYSCELGLQQPCGKCLSCKDLEKLNAGEKF